MNRLFKAVKSVFSLFYPLKIWLGEQFDSSISPERRRRNRIILSVLIGIFIVASTSQILFYGSRSQIPIANNLLIVFLLNINIILLLVVATVVGRNIFKLLFERKSKTAGRRFQTKLIISFATFTLIPSIFLFVVASGLITNAIDNWFSETVEKSLKDSLEVAETLYKSSEQAVSIKAAKLAQLIKAKRMLDEKNKIFLQNTVANNMEEYGVEQIIVYDIKFNVLAEAGKPKANFTFPKPDDSGMFKLEQGTPLTKVQIGDKASMVFTLAPITSKGSSLVGTVFIADSIDRSVVVKINAITKTFDDYKQLKLQKVPIKAVYEVTLLLVTLVVLFSAVWYGFYLARDITVPIYQLADATEKVTEGDLSVRLEVKTGDEIGALMNSFNRMTEELDTSRSKLEASHKELVEANLEIDRRRKYIETIFSKIVTGVISIDNRGRITTLNPAAKSILSIKSENALGVYYEDVFDPVHLEPMRTLMRQMGKSEKDSLEDEIQVIIDDVKLTLFVHIATLRDPGGKFLGLVVVFDDLTAVINAQKTAAWRDIAQYMAHEIKNPLTPIQLNTERLIRRYRQNPENFGEIFENSTKIIIQEVEVLKGLVDEFRRFAQLPEPKPSMASLHEIINNVVGMYQDIKKGVSINTSFDRSIGLVRLDAEQMHRVFRNLIENATDALGEEGEIEIRTSRDKEASRILIEIVDNGPGINPKDVDKVFLPYFSTKRKGSGLGLAIVNRIVADHEGHIKVKNRSPQGTIMAIDLPVS